MDIAAAVADAFDTMLDSRLLYRAEVYWETGILYVSNSVLANVPCHTKAVLSAWGYANPEGRAPRDVGTAAHVGLAAFRRGEPIDDALAAVAASYDALAIRVPDDDRLCLDNVTRILRHVMTEQQLSLGQTFRVHPEMVEVGFAEPLTDDGTIVMCGRLDTLVQDVDSDGWYVEDHKTTGQLNAQFIKEYAYTAQMTGYCWGASRQLGEAVGGAYINAIELSWVPRGERKCSRRDHHGLRHDECGLLHPKRELFLAERNPAQLAAWERDAKRAAVTLRSLLDRAQGPADLAPLGTQGTFINKMCLNCDFNDFCATGRQPAMLDVMLERAPFVLPEPAEEAATA